MNIFILDPNPKEAARLQCDKHVVKMILESAQMLSTSHRMLDGTLEYRPSVSGKRMVKYYKHPDQVAEDNLYKAVHFDHPCTEWTMETKENYMWHYEHFLALGDEYTYRYGKHHKVYGLAQSFISSTKKHSFRIWIDSFPFGYEGLSRMYDGECRGLISCFLSDKAGSFQDGLD